LIINQENKILFSIHGHCHYGAKSDKVGNALIVNPGSLAVSKSYMILELGKNNSKWILESFKSYKIN
jgi:Icc-related predicted phosphoesterase